MLTQNIAHGLPIDGAEYLDKSIIEILNPVTEKDIAKAEEEASEIIERVLGRF